MKRFLLIVLVVFILIVIVGGVFICSQKDKIANYAIEKTMAAAKSQIMGNLPENIEADSARVVIDSVMTQLQRGKIDQTQVQYLASNFQTAFNDGKLDSSEVVRLIDTMKKIVHE